MDRRKVLGLGLSTAFALGSWALSQLVQSLRWLPYFALAFSVVAMGFFGAWLFFDWRREHRRKSLPGISVNLGIRIDDQQEARRRYYFDLAGPGQNGASFYRSASGRFVFSVEDVNGEPYTIEVRPGEFGIPVAQSIYLCLEAGTDGIRTTMRVAVDGRIIAERKLPFAVQFPPFAGLVLGSNRHHQLSGAYRLYMFASYEGTLNHEDARNMLQFVRERLPDED